MLEARARPAQASKSVLLCRALDGFFADSALGLPSRVLEIGCGPGHGTVWLDRRLRHWHDPERSVLVCVDRDLGALGEARERLREQGTGERGAGEACFLRADGYRLPVPDGAFDRVFALNVMHYVALRPFAREVQRVLKPTGGLLIYNYSPQLKLTRFSVPLRHGQLAMLFERPAAVSPADSGEPGPSLGRDQAPLGSRKEVTKT